MILTLMILYHLWNNNDYITKIEYAYTWFLELYIHYTNQNEEGTRKGNLY